MLYGYNMFPLMGMQAEDIVAACVRTEELGYESVWMPDHFIFPPRISKTYPFSPTGESPWRPDHHLYDPFVLLSHVAAHTKRLKLGIHVLLLPLRDTIATARATATLDLFSGGRVLFGAGLGWLKDEYQIAGRDWRTRGAAMDEQLQTLKALWTQPVARFQGKHVQLPECVFEPKPAQKPHPPIHIGGSSPSALRRAARYGDGWTGIVHQVEETRRIVEELHRLRKEHGRRGPFEITVMSPDPDADLIQRYEAVGVHRLLVLPAAERSPTRHQFTAALERFARRAVGKG